MIDRNTVVVHRLAAIVADVPIPGQHSITHHAAGGPVVFPIEVTVKLHEYFP